MKEKIENLKKEIKSRDPLFFRKIIEKKVSDKELLDKELMILNYFDQDSNSYLRYILDVTSNGSIIEISYPNSKEAIEEKKYSLIKNNYLVKPYFENYYKLNLNEDVNWKKSERANFRQILENISLQKSNKGYWLSGKFGIGKTFMSICFLNFAAEQGEKVAYLSMPEFALFYGTTAEENKKLNDKIEAYKNADVLLFDDIGAEKTSEWFRNNIFFSILNVREQKAKLTLFTSNLTIEEYRKKILLNQSASEKLAVARIIERIYSLVDEIKIISNENYRLNKMK